MSATHRQRRKRALASFLNDPYVDGKYTNYYGDPRKAPQRWKQLWERQHKFVVKARAAIRRNERIKHKSAWEGFKAQYPELTDAELESRGFVKEASKRAAAQKDQP